MGVHVTLFPAFRQKVGWDFRHVSGFTPEVHAIHNNQLLSYFRLQHGKDEVGASKADIHCFYIVWEFVVS